MKNCLTTKLKSSVENRNLHYLGEFRLYNVVIDNPTMGSNCVVLNFNAPVTIVSVDGANCIQTISNAGSRQASDALPSSGWVNRITTATTDPICLCFANTDSEIVILDKYSITGIRQEFGYAGMKSFGIDLSQIEYSAITSINCIGIRTKGTLTNPSKLTVLSIGLDNELKLQEGNIDVELFPGTLVTTDLRYGKNTHGNLDVWINRLKANSSSTLNNLWFIQTNVTGTIEAIIQCMAAKGKTSTLIVTVTGNKFAAGTRMLEEGVVRISSNDSGVTYTVTLNNNPFGTYTVASGSWSYSE